MTATKQEYTQCAERYLNFWEDTDSIACPIFANPQRKWSESLQEEVNRILCNYGIDCNFPEECEVAKNKNRFEPVLDIIDMVSESDLERDGVVKTVDRVREEFKDFYDKNLIVAASKTLWFKFQAPIVIIDSRAEGALKIEYQGPRYEIFFRAWQDEFKQEKGKISDACAELAQTHPNHNDKICLPWFAERVLDRYLWEKGGGR